MKRLVRRFLDAADERRRLDDRTSPATKIALRSLLAKYKRYAADGRLPSVWDTGFRVFSQFDEDGVILFLLAVAGDGPKRVLDLGAGDGVQASNCANLLLNLGFDGLLVDGDAAYIARAERFYARHPDTKERPPTTKQAFLTRENVNDVVSASGLEGEIDLLSIDVDGNDYWLWEALECVRPRFVVVEAHPELGREHYVMPYQADFAWSSAPLEGRYGASLRAFVLLGERLGYRAVGSNQYGFNVFFAREDVAQALPVVSLDLLFERARI
ncbi:MAG: hypothetical protein K0S65_4110 [Labilithrix sp.]|jgi:hypothetical protein|nr:hypothetical protein [Labilithrix sp.]